MLKSGSQPSSARRESFNGLCRLPHRAGSPLEKISFQHFQNFIPWFEEVGYFHFEVLEVFSFQLLCNGIK
jgi:hypothetical protein